MPAIRKIARDSAAGDYRWSSLVLAVVRSTPFTMSVGASESDDRRRPQDRTAGLERIASRRHANDEEGSRMMIITKRAIPRRTVLRGLGAALALPLLDGMVPALSALGEDGGQAASTGFGVVYVPNGVIMKAYLPATEGTAYELSPTLSPLAPFREQMLVRQRPELRAVAGPARRISRQGQHAVPDRRVAADQRDRARRRDLDGSDSSPTSSGKQHAARVARAVDRIERNGRRLRRRFRLRLHEHDFLEEREHAAADAEQPARGVRAAVRRQRAAPMRGAAGAESRKSAASSTR